MIPVAAHIVAEGFNLEKDVEDGLIPGLLWGQDICGYVKDVILSGTKPCDTGMDSIFRALREFSTIIGILGGEACGHGVHKCSYVKGPDGL